MSAAANASASARRNCPGRHQRQGGERHDEAEPLDQHPEQAYRSCNHRQRHDMKARDRLAGEHDRARDQGRPQRREQGREQQRKIAWSHFAGCPQGISARGENGDGGKAAEHHARPEILRRTDSHACRHTVACNRRIKSAAASCVNGAEYAGLWEIMSQFAWCCLNRLRPREAGTEPLALDSRFRGDERSFAARLT
jgi:hypothetical protein